MENIKVNNKFVDYTGLYLIGILSSGYLVASSYFAKFHLYLRILDVPFFIGDIVFLICLCLFFLKQPAYPKKPGTIAYLLLFYLVFVIIKTSLGYFCWGPLALRHAVLFFYPFFAVFSYSFYRNNFFNDDKKIIIVCLITFILNFLPFYRFFILTCCALLLILLNAYQRGAIKCILYLLLLLSIPYKMFFVTSRSFVISNLIAIIYMSFGFLYIVKIKKMYKFIFLLFIIFTLLYGIFKVSISNEIRSLIGFKELTHRYSELVSILNIEEGKHVDFRELKIRLYNEKTPPPPFFRTMHKDNIEPSGPSQPKDLGEKKEVKKEEKVKKEERVKKEETDNRPKVLWDADYVAPEEMERGNRGANVPYVNSLFRIVVWKEALEQLINKRPLFGFDFGKPFRCRTLEILNWATKEWERVGWVCFHNSYIDIIYRAGVIGVLMIISILAMLFFLIKRAVLNKSFTAILLTGILLNWLIPANFSEVLEMPYTAIPLWSLFGLTFAYLFKGRSV